MVVTDILNETQPCFIESGKNIMRDYPMALYQDNKGVYKIGTFDNGIEIYKAPPEVLPTDEFIYYDNALATFKKGKIINIYDRTNT